MTRAVIRGTGRHRPPQAVANEDMTVVVHRRRVQDTDSVKTVWILSSSSQPSEHLGKDFW